MLQEVSQYVAHTASHDENHARFNEACYMFVESVPSELVKYHLPAASKTISISFMKMVVHCRDARMKISVPSGIAAVSGVRESQWTTWLLRWTITK